MPKAKYVNRFSLGVTDEQFSWLCEEVRLGFAEDIAGVLRRLINERREVKVVA